MATTSITASGREDGRSARAARTREAVVEALLSLNDEGNLRPTAREIADRAAVSLRSVYVHFEDLEDLFSAAAAKQFERLISLYEPMPTTGPLGERLDAFVSQRTRIMEAAAPVRRAALLQEPFSPALAEVMTLTRNAGRDEIERVFANELDRERGAARARLRASLDVAAGPSTWESLRAHEGLSVEQARLVITEMLTKLLASG
jgi:TetR/AcrR family transcriptional regulator, regulator of autoinduction and epiphytic fitness